MKKSNQQSLGEAIKSFLKANQLDEKLLETEIYARWEELAGKSINLRTTKVAFKHDILTVYVNSSVIRNELNMNRTALLERINQRLMGKAVIKDLIIR